MLRGSPPSAPSSASAASSSGRGRGCFLLGAAASDHTRRLRSPHSPGCIPRHRLSPRRHSVSVCVAASMDWRNKANKREARPENVAGSFFVDRTCIDCDTCRWMAPDTFGRVGPQSAVVAQPADRAGRVAALRALLSCPTYSIHVTDRTASELREAQDGLPAPVPGMTLEHIPPPPATADAAAVPPGAGDGAVDAGAAGASAAAAASVPARPGVYYTGWASEKSFAGCAYLVVRPQGGNILVDSPRFSPVLARRIAALGGVRHMFLTHKDDVGDHEAWAAHFGATRILHESEVNTRQGTDRVEVKLSGEGPWVLSPNGDVVPAPSPAAASASASAAASGAAGAGEPDVTFVLTPGHTSGHVCMYYAPLKALFSGDHLSSAAGEVEGAAQDRLYVFKDFNWYSFPQQLASVAKLLQYDWLHVLPAHGRRAHLRDAAARLAAVSDLLQQHGEDGAAAAAAAVAAGAAIMSEAGAAAASLRAERGI